MIDQPFFSVAITVFSAKASEHQFCFTEAAYISNSAFCRLL